VPAQIDPFSKIFYIQFTIACNKLSLIFSWCLTSANVYFAVCRKYKSVLLFFCLCLYLSAFHFPLSTCYFLRFFTFFFPIYNKLQRLRYVIIHVFFYKFAFAVLYIFKHLHMFIPFDVYHIIIQVFQHGCRPLRH